MIATLDQVVIRAISAAEMTMLKRKSQLAMIGGKSNIRTQQDRQDNLAEDQLIGLVGQYAFTSLHCGSAQPFLIQRWYADHHSHQGDISDIPGTNIDVKSSRLNQTRSILKHSLVVRAKEYRENTIYVLTLVDIVAEQNRLSQVYIIGWIEGGKMPPQPNRDGVFAGAYSVIASELNPVMPIRWYS